MLIEQSFLSGSNILLKNANVLDSLLYPLAQWKGTSEKGNKKDGKILFNAHRIILSLVYCRYQFDHLLWSSFVLSSIISIFPEE